MKTQERIADDLATLLPRHRDLYYGGRWHQPLGGYLPTFNPGTGESLGEVAEANEADVNAAVLAANEGFKSWRRTKPLERAKLMRKVAAVLREHSDELAMLDAANCGAPVAEMARDVANAAAQWEFFAGLVTEIKGDTIPMGEGVVNLSVREPLGVVARIVAYNHPLMFTAAKAAAPIAAGNTVIMKPPYQAPMSALRFAELVDGILPPGVLNILSGGTPCGQALVAHPDVPAVSLIGSVPTGRAIARSAADRLKHVSLELGGKNACIVYPDADIARAIKGAVAGMNFTWCSQSCGSTSRLFVHSSIHDQVVEGVIQGMKAYKPGLPTDRETNMGAVISQAQLDKIRGYIALGQQEGASLAYGGRTPADPALAGGYYVEPTLFVDVKASMRLATEEVFGPVLSVIKWDDEKTMLEEVNAVEYGLTAAIFSSNLANAHRAAAEVQAGFVWINNAGPHFLGTGYGGYKQSGIGREECLEELLSFTQSKNINITL